MTPKEDPADKAARLRERRLTDIERTKTTQESAAGLTSDLHGIYGMGALGGSTSRNSLSMFGKMK